MSFALLETHNPQSAAFAALSSSRVQARSYIDARSGWLDVGSRWLNGFARYDTIDIYMSFVNIRFDDK